MSDMNGSSGGKRLAVYAVVDPPADDDSKKGSRWTKIGIAYVNRDGSMNLFLDAFPIGTNKLQVREDDRASAPAGTPGRRNGFETVEVRP